MRVDKALPRSNLVISTYVMPGIYRRMPAFRDELLLKLYETVHQPENWRGFLDHICTGVNVRSAIVQRIRPGGSTLETTWIAFDSHSEEHAGQHALVVNDAMNPRMQFEYDSPLAMGQIAIACDEDLPMPTQVRRRFQDGLGDVGLGKGIFAGMEMPSSPKPGSDGISLVLHRHPGETADYSTQEREFLAGLMPHLSQAMMISDRLSQSARQTYAMERVLDRVRPALIICDADARLVWANQTAHSFLKEPGTLKMIGGRLSCPRHDRSQDLHRLIHKTSTHNGDETLDQRCLVVDEHAAYPMHVMVMPLQKRDDDGESHVALFLSRAGAPFEIPAKLLEKLFRLSPAEAKLAKAIAEGGAVNSYALINGLAEGTVRFQLKQVLAKTGCPRQSDLVRLICTTLMNQFGM